MNGALLDQTPAVTGALLPWEDDFDVVRRWLAEGATGDEYGGIYLVSRLGRARLWGLSVTAAEPEAVGPNEVVADNLAAQLAREVPAVPVQRAQLPKLTGDLLDDVRSVTGLTIDQIARANRVSGRAVAGWRGGRVPQHREALLQALRSIGLSLVGGLGPAGVQRWLTAGRRPRLDRLAAGEVDDIAEEARSYETSPAT